MQGDSETIPVYPDHPSDSEFKLYAVTWLSMNGEMYTRLIGGRNHEEAASTILYGVDVTIRRGTNHASIDVRECGKVKTFKPTVEL